MEIAAADVVPESFVALLGIEMDAQAAIQSRIAPPSLGPVEANHLGPSDRSGAGDGLFSLVLTVIMLPAGCAKTMQRRQRMAEAKSN